jgi:serralysin
LVGNGGHDLLIGGSGHDRLQGDDGNDTLIAAGGNDTLVGGGGNDLYQISRGGWRTVISDLETSPGRGNADVLKLIDLSASEVTAVGRDANSLLIRFSSSDQVVVTNYFLGRDWKVESFHFSDGLVWGATTISERLIP